MAYSKLYSLRQRLEDDYKLDQYRDTVMLDQIIYNTKPATYQMQLDIIKDKIRLEDIRLKADISYVRGVTLDYVQAKYRETHATLKQHQGKLSSKGPVILLLLVPLQLRRSSPSLSRMIAASVVNKVRSLWNATHAQRTIEV
jgi:hypothetical protein